MQKIGKTGAEAIFLGGLLSENGAQIIKDKVSVLGPNDGKVKLYTPDGFTLQNTIDTAGAASKGIIGSVAGLPYEKLTPDGQAFYDGFKAKYNLESVDPYAIYGAAATQVVLNALANASDRADVIAQMFATKIDTVIGPVEFNAGGDRASSPVTIYLAGAHFDPIDVVSPTPELLDAARGIK